MTITTEISLKDFEFWSGAKDTAKYLTEYEFDFLKAQMSNIFPDGASETDINDLFWFEEDFIAELLGYCSFEEIIMQKDI